MALNVVRLTLFVTFIVLINGNLVVNRFRKLESDAYLTTSQPKYLARSSLECFQACGTTTTICGVNYVKASRKCACFTKEEFVKYDVVSISTGSVYVIESCAPWSTNTSPSSTKTASNASTTTSQPMSTNSTAADEQVTSSTQTQAFDTPSSFSYVTETTTGFSTTTQQKSCFPSAMFSIQGVIFLFIGNDVMTYTSLDDMINQPLSQQSLTSLFASVNDTVFSAYADDTNVYVFIGTNVQTYEIINSTSFVYKSDHTIQSFFGSDVFQIIDDIIFVTSSKARHVFSNDTVTIIEADGKESVSNLGNNGAKNPYKSTNNSYRPLNIVAACELNSDIHVFVSNGNVYTFTLSGNLWVNDGLLVC